MTPTISLTVGIVGLEGVSDPRIRLSPIIGAR